MTWTLTDDVDLFAERALPALARDPVANTMVLGIVDTLRSGLRYSDHVPVFCWQDGGSSGAALMTPPYEMILAEVRESDIEDLVVALRDCGVDVTGVNADDAPAAAFARAWTSGTSLEADVVRHQRLYRLRELVPVAH